MWKFLRAAVSKEEGGASPRPLFLLLLEADWATWPLGGGGRLTCLASRISPSPGREEGGASGLPALLSAPARERSRSRARGGSMSPKKAVVAALGALCLAAVAGLVLLCVPTKDVQDPPAFKVRRARSAGHRRDWRRGAPRRRPAPTLGGAPTAVSGAPFAGAYRSSGAGRGSARELRAGARAKARGAGAESREVASLAWLGRCPALPG